MFFGAPVISHAVGSLESEEVDKVERSANPTTRDPFSDLTNLCSYSSLLSATLPPKIGMCPKVERSSSGHFQCPHGHVWQVCLFLAFCFEIRTFL